jgi:hypothetical protein
MKCRIKRTNNDSYFNKNLGEFNHWTPRSEAKLFDSVAEARATMKIHKLKIEE